jgi:long-chain acyl-CoA synthetase
VLQIEDLIHDAEPVRRFGPVRPPLVLYTSGTTGKPKGVPSLDLARADLARVDRYYRSVLTHPDLPAMPRTLLTLPVHHGAGPFAAAATCQRGGVVVTLDPFDAQRAVGLIQEHQLNTWTAVPTMLLRIKALPAEVLDQCDLTSIEVLTVGAAAVPFSLKEWAVDRFGEGVLWEGYGCSEAGMIAGTSPADQLSRPGTSGKPFDEVVIRIVDDDWNDLAIGEVGEIAVSTPVMVDHYLGRERMGEDQLRDGFYRTGDVGHLDEDGYLYITDRVKDMIVAGGSNIYPAEVEAALVQHPDIVDCAVIGIPHEEFGEDVMAFVVPKPGTAPTIDDIRSFLDGRLARYKMPRSVEHIAELPLNPTGKVTKAVLRDRFWADRGRKV